MQDAREWQQNTGVYSPQNIWWTPVKFMELDSMSFVLIEQYSPMLILIRLVFLKLNMMLKTFHEEKKSNLNKTFA